MTASGFRAVLHPGIFNIEPQRILQLSSSFWFQKFQRNQSATFRVSGVLSLLVVNTIAIAQKKHLGKLQRRQAEVRQPTVMPVEGLQASDYKCKRNLKY